MKQKKREKLTCLRSPLARPSNQPTGVRPMYRFGTVTDRWVPCEGRQSSSSSHAWMPPRRRPLHDAGRWSRPPQKRPWPPRRCPNPLRIHWQPQRGDSCPKQTASSPPHLGPRRRRTGVLELAVSYKVTGRTFVSPFSFLAISQSLYPSLLSISRRSQSPELSRSTSFQATSSSRDWSGRSARPVGSSGREELERGSPWSRDFAVPFCSTSPEFLIVHSIPATIALSEHILATLVRFRTSGYLSCIL
jgi:hypothetical protein